MLLTLKPPVQNGVKGPHEYSVIRQSIPTPRSSPPTLSEPSTVAAAPPAVTPVRDRLMDPSAPRRSLPPPSAMSLPLPPDLALPAMGVSGSQLPPPPPPPPPSATSSSAQWQSADDSMRLWLQAKAEEDRRKQEEEKTRQESLRLEQRRIEQAMLRDSFQAGVPPQMVPLIFAGLGGGSLSQSAWESIQQQQNQQQQAALRPGGRGSVHSMPPPPPSMSSSDLSGSPLPPPPSVQRRLQPLAETRLESRGISLPPYPAPTAAGSGKSLPQPPKLADGPSSTPPSFARSVPSLPSRINNAVDIQHQQPPSSHIFGNAPPYLLNSPAAPLPPPSSVKHETPSQQQPSSIYFHHWVPPGQSHQNGSMGKTQQDSTASSSAPSHSRSEYQGSPGRKRKATGGHQPAPPPTSSSSSSSARQSPSATGARSGDRQVHARNHSDASESYGSRGPSPSTVPARIAESHPEKNEPAANDSQSGQSD
ncbi:hypothetical protein ASPZODRAFT_135062 [Penicilliopsis zonata CBS 506.65]|uniref:Uncharacterized protein n=1 Tax=Penicilliopsis zonata CBS 506.65 TaxID=1073090 RepID=A0A1L9SAV1_9EURO|nr:hypothetical protein ASPZODRAFT_135062 [Penicilliopsis zonata CBS 506.65]OJJ44266.1 hypothetical protein ASPZODRAFT_135062 [Penicilliopsis zonata CBS 506.65]